jgi:iron complex outermembrane receptor protein
MIFHFNFENTESQKAYGMANLRVGITSDHFDISVWARNINDVRYMAWGTFGSYMLGSPRMLGVSLAFKL